MEGFFPCLPLNPLHPLADGDAVAAGFKKQILSSDLYQGNPKSSASTKPEPDPVALTPKPTTGEAEQQTELRELESSRNQFPLVPAQSHASFARLVLEASQGRPEAIRLLLARAPEASKDGELVRPYGMGLAEALRGIGPDRSQEWVQKSSGEVTRSVAICLRAALGRGQVDEEFGYLK